MPQVAVQINGKTYRMACDPGEEAHLLDLAQRFDRYIARLKGSFGEIGDQRLTVMAGVMVTDELAEAQKKIQALEIQVEEARSLAPDNPDQQERVAEALLRTAERVESLTAKLDDTA